MSFTESNDLQKSDGPAGSASACTNCTESRVYDAFCQPCRVRLVRSCRSTSAPKVARRQQEGMLAYIERRAGARALEMTINELKGGAQ